MGITATVILIGLVLGAAQLAAGVVIGRCLPLREGRARPDDPIEPDRLQTAGRQLHQLVSSVANDVDEHNQGIERARRQLDAVQPLADSPLAEIVLGTIAQVMEVNQRLQNRLSAAEDKLQQQAVEIESHINDARTDPLTGLPNRRAFDDELGRRVAEWQRKQTVFCLMMIDADHFKALNDRYGHPAGDTVLRWIAEVLRDTMREMDMVARIGGEEFAVILPSTNPHDARRATERVRAAVADTPVQAGQSEIHLTVSLGLATVAAGDDPTSLLRRADDALYASKHSGRNCGHFHNGQTCEKIVFNTRSTVDDHTNASQPPPADDTELLLLSDDLRNRLGQVVDDLGSATE